jgi:signal transduction histidine kinase
MILQKELGQRIKWLINLRWIAVIGVFIAITSTKYVLRIELPLSQLYFGNMTLFLYNILFLFYNRRLESYEDNDKWFKKATLFANLQISLDLIMLTFLIHFSGGVENPFIFYFIFHMVNASILLSNRAAYLQATLGIIVLGTVIGGEYLGILPHYHLGMFIPGKLCLLSLWYLIGVFSVFSTTLYITVYMATCIVNRLRKEEKDLAIANKKLEEQDRLKSQYVLTVSHDLQSSLSTIQSCLKVVLSDLTGSISEKSREMIARAEQRSRYVLHFVKDLLDLSKIKTTKELEKKTISLSKIVRKVIDQLKLKAEEKRLALSVENSTNSSLISANPDALEQLLVNLIVNAIRYTPWGGNVGIQIKEKPDCFQTVIWDTGIGISQEDLVHIFEDFYRTKNAELMEKDGTGLGLSIVKQIIDAHGGEIWVESGVGKGSRFIFTLPKEKSI